MKQVFIIMLLIIAGAAIVGFTTGMFSLIDGGVENGPTCEIEATGGSCDLILELPAGKQVGEGYSLDLATQPIHDEEFKGEREAFLSASGGPYLEEDNMANTDYDNTYVYTYLVPTEWQQDAYQFQTVTTISDASVRTGGEGRGYLYLYSGFTTIPYPYSIIEVETVNDGYNEDYALVSNYIGNDGEWYVSTRHMTLGGGDDLYVRGDSSSYPSSLSRPLVSTMVISGSLIPEYDAKFTARVEESQKYYDGRFVHSTPTMKVSWKEEYTITDLVVTLAGEQFYGIPGKVEGTVYLPDMSAAINDYCGRTGLFPEDDNCVIKMKMTSSEGGNIIITNELGELKEIGGDFNFNSITGWVTFDVQNEPANAYTTYGLLLLVVIGLGAVVLFYGGKKK